MAKALFKLGRFSYLHKWTVIIAWFLILAGLGGAVAAFQKGFIDQFSIPGMPSATASHVIEEKFPDVPNPIREQRIYVAFEAPEGQRLDDPQNKEAVDQVINGIRDNVGQIADDLQLHNPVDLNPKMQAMVKEQGMAAGLPKDVAEADANAMRTVSDDGRAGSGEAAGNRSADAARRSGKQDMGHGTALASPGAVAPARRHLHG